jgi:hypothetical protein
MLIVQVWEAMREGGQPFGEAAKGPLKVGLMDWAELLALVRTTGSGELVAPAKVVEPKSSEGTDAVTSVVLLPVTAMGKVNEPPFTEIQRVPEKAPTCPAGVKVTLMEHVCELASVPMQLSDSVRL